LIFRFLIAVKQLLKKVLDIGLFIVYTVYSVYMRGTNR
jgi:hypothetical protein